MIVSIDTEKVFVKMQYSFTITNLSNLEIEQNFFHIIMNI